MILQLGNEPFDTINKLKLCQKYGFLPEKIPVLIELNLNNFKGIVSPVVVGFQNAIPLDYEEYYDLIERHRHGFNKLAYQTMRAFLTKLSGVFDMTFIIRDMDFNHPEKVGVILAALLGDENRNWTVGFDVHPMLHRGLYEFIRDAGYDFRGTYAWLNVEKFFRRKFEAIHDECKLLLYAVRNYIIPIRQICLYCLEAKEKRDLEIFKEMEQILKHQESEMKDPNI